MLIVIVILVVTIMFYHVHLYGGMTVGRHGQSWRDGSKHAEGWRAGFINLFKEGKYCNLKPDEENPSPILQVDITLYYYKR